MKRQKFLARFSRQTLTVKLVITVSAVVCLIVTIGVLVLMDVSYRGIAQTSVTTALYHAQFLKNKLIENMLDSTFNKEAFKETLDFETRRLGLKEVNVFNTEGVTRFSSIPENINKRIDLTADQEDRLTPDKGMIHFSDMNREGQLRIVHPIRGHALCMSCHENAQNKMLGGIELFVPLKPIYERFTVSRFILIFSALAIIILSAILIRWVVHKIVKRLFKAVGNYVLRITRTRIGSIGIGSWIASKSVMAYFEIVLPKAERVFRTGVFGKPPRAILNSTIPVSE